MISFRSVICLAAACVLLAGPVSESVRAAAADDHAHTEGADDDAGHSDDGHGEKKTETMELKKDLALWSLVTFICFILVLRMFAWGPLITGLDKRESNLRDHLAQAEAARQQSERMLKEHAEKLSSVQDEVKAIIDEAKRDAEHTKNDIITTAQKEAQVTQDRAIHEINRARDQALKELFDVMSAQVATATEQVVGRSLGGDDQQRLINEALSQFNSSN